MELSNDVYLFLKNGSIFLFYTLILVTLMFTLATAYHWFRFGSSKSTNVLGLLIHLGVCALLFILMSVFITTM